MRMTVKSQQKKQIMNVKNRSVAGIGLAVCSAMAVAATGCRTQVIHERTRTVYAPAPAPVVYVPPAPAPQPPAPVVVVPPPVQPPVVVIQSENDFYEPLGAYGRWVMVGAYGRCWIPARVEVGWRPYSNGYWQRTDAGWYWASEEPWGWATYHYGRWDFHTEFGWIWVPHTQWAPAWVCWREGGGYVGWAPLRPSVTIGVSIGAVNYEPAFASRAFVFVEHRRMLEPVRPKTVIVNNTTIINKTVNITNVKVVNKTVINEGPRPEVIERASGRKVLTVPVHEFRHREETTVAARERNIPTAARRMTQPPALTQPQPAERKTVLPPAARQIEKPTQVVTQLPQPLAAPAQPTPRQSEIGRPARDERKHEPEAGAKVTTTRRGDRPMEQPAVAAKPTPQPVGTNPVRDEKKRETENEKTTAATPPSVELKPSREVRPETRQESKPRVQAESAPSSAVKKQSAPPSQKSVDKRLISPKEKARGAEQGPIKKKKEDKGQKKKGEAQETPPVAPSRPLQ